MKIPLWLLAILFVGWTAWSVNRYWCQKCGCCGDTVTETTTQTSGEPLFNWNADQPVKDANFATFKKDLIKKGAQGDTLVITGLYREKESFTPGKYANLGLARAAAVMAMMAPEFPANRTKIMGKLVSDNLSETSAAGHSVDFSWQKMVLAMDKGAVIESDNDVIILFPFNSTEKDKDPKVDEYLKTLVAKHKDDKSSFTIVGHTDNVGDDKRNEAIGLARAQSIEAILVHYGISKDRIKTSSKGKAEPVADNATDDGRHQNRRVVITVNQ